MGALDFLKTLAEAFFSAFSKAVTEYPFTTAIVLASVAYYMQQSRYVVFYENERIKTIYTTCEKVAALIGFVLAIVIAFFVGYVFSAVTGALGWLFGAGQEFVSPFKKHPVEFTAILAIFALAEVAWLAFLTRGKLRNAEPLLVLSLAFGVLFATYVVTSIYTGLRGDKPEPATTGIHAPAKD
jgi:hypothetical protein